jgi:predicted nuclease of predicted toxin-antitoxin system
VKLLFDENVSPKLVQLLEAEFPESAHVYDLGLRGATDRRIWEHAHDNGFMIVSKDDDFRQRSFLQGAPPKVVWLRVGNAGTAAIAGLLREQAARLSRFEDEDESALLIVSMARRAV